MEIINSGARSRGAIFVILLASVLWLPVSASALPVFINELHYDNRGTDRDEGVEIAAPAGTHLDGWQLLFYDGRRGRVYASIDLSGRVSDAGQGYGFHQVRHAGIQNGAPDGLALVDALGRLVQFLSYEGAFEAISGIAAGRRSSDIGIAEAADTPVGYSLQLTGVGRAPDQFQWVLAEASFGSVNSGQRFGDATATLPEPGVPALLTLGLLAGLWQRRKVRP